MRLFLGIPSAGAPAKPFIESLSRLELPAELSAFERGIVTGNFVPAQRDVLLERAIAWNAGTIVMCDDDMVLPPDTLQKLCHALSAHPDAAIVGALYYSRDGLRPMVVDGWDPNDTRQGWIPAFDDRTPVAVDGIGFGCAAIRVAAVCAFERPFFPSHVYVEREAGRVRICDEDYLFCARVREAGFGVMLHPGVRCGHYDRGRDWIAPVAWETPDRTGIKRVLARSGEQYELIPLAQAPQLTQSESRVRADVVYVLPD